MTEEEATNPTSSTSDPPTDEEGLLLEYDVILCGTGLVQSILASALARAGKSVLHVDAASHYGELDAVLTLDQVLEVMQEEAERSADVQEGKGAEEVATTTATRSIPLQSQPEIRFLSMDNEAKVKVEIGTKVSTPYGDGTVLSLPSLPTGTENDKRKSASLAISLLADETGDGRANGKGKGNILYVGVPQGESTETEKKNSADFVCRLLASNKIIPVEQHNLDRLLIQQARSFALDISPQLIYASGKAVEGFLISNVSEYLEFKSIEGLLWYDNSVTSKVPGKAQVVPCSKADVFASKLLAPLDKRRLMKFMQLVMDYGTSMQMKEIAISGTAQDQTQRPDKEDSSSGHLQVQQLNELHLNQGRSLARPQNKAVSTTDLESLTTIMEENKLSLEEYLLQQHKLSKKLCNMIRYAIALEQQSTSTSATGLSIGLQQLDVRQGMKRITDHLQGLGRYGGTAFLQPMYGSGEFAQAFSRSAAVHGATYLLRRCPKSIDVAENAVTGVTLVDEETQKGKTIKCDNVVCPQHLFCASSSTAAAAASTPNSRAWRLRRVSILPKSVVKQSREQRHLLFLPPTDDGFIPHPVQGLVLDWNARVAPPDSSLLHLSTTVTDLESNKTVLEKAAKHVLHDVSLEREIYQVTFAYPICNNDEMEEASEIEGLFVCDSSPRLVADYAFEEAKRLFEKICPGGDFLALSEEMDKTIRERQVGMAEEDDDERAVLDSAMDIIATAGDGTDNPEMGPTDDETGGARAKVTEVG